MTEEYELRVCDLNAIESRVIGWLSGCERLNKVFADGLDPYKDFGKEMYGKPYDQITKKERNDSKPGSLGCLGAFTQVLTPRGFVRIVNLQADDLIHDGEGWQAHGGVIAQGRKEVFDLGGLQITKDHLVLTPEGWQEAWHVHQNTQSVLRATDLANGLLKATFARTEATSTTSAAVSDVDEHKRFTDTTLNLEKRARASSARTPKFWSKKARSTCFSPIGLVISSIAWPTATTPFCRVVAAPARLGTATAAGASPASSKVLKTSSGTASRWLAWATQGSKSTALTTTGTTRKAISDSCLLRPIIATRRGCGGSNTKENAGSPKTFGERSRRAIAVLRRFVAKSARAFRLSKSSRTSGFVKVPTYDVSNAGPLNRFVVLTDRGPLVVHNCGFRLGGGALDPVTGKRTGLWGYAEKMGVDLTQEQSEQNVKVFRAIYPEIPVLWYDFESAAAKCMRTSQPVNVGPFLRFERRAPYLMLRLPSGRFIYYFQPKMVELWFAKHPTKGHIKNLGQDAARAERAKEKGWKVWSKVNLSYMGKPQNKPGWVRLPTHGGKLTENAVQAVARDILKEGMLRADEDGFNIVGHVYDEIITCHTKTDTYHTVKRLADLMTQPIDWAPGLLLGAAGWSGSFYKKD